MLTLLTNHTLHNYNNYDTQLNYMKCSGVRQTDNNYDTQLNYMKCSGVRQTVADKYSGIEFNTDPF